MSAPDNRGSPLVPPELRPQLRQEQPWNTAAILEYAMRNTGFDRYVDLLFNAEQHDGCPREASDAFIAVISSSLPCVVANGKVDTAGILGVFRDVQSARINGWYARLNDTRRLTKGDRALRHFRYLQRVMRRGTIARRRDIALEVEENVPILDDRPVVEEVLRAGKPSESNGRIDRDAIARKLVEFGITDTAWGSTTVMNTVKRPLGVFRREVDDAQRAAMAVMAPVVVSVSMCMGTSDIPVVLEPEPVTPPAPEPVVVTASSSPETGKKRGYVRRERNLAPRAEPMVIDRPMPRDVEVRYFLVDVLGALGARAGRQVAFVSARVMQAVARKFFPSYVEPMVGISKMAHRGYVTNVGLLGRPAVWRVEPIDVGEIVLSPEIDTREGEADDLVRNAFASDEDFAAEIAWVFDSRMAPYLPTWATV